MGKVRVLLADDHKFITEGLKGILEPEYEVIGVVEDGHELVKKAASLRPDVIVVDISMPKLNGIEAVRQIREEDSDVRVIFLTMHPDVTYASRAIEAGAQGFVLKHSAPAELLVAIEKSLKNERFITRSVEQQLEDITHSRKDPIRKLTGRQREVLQLLAEGHSARKIGDILFISPRTVEFHKYKIMEELGIHNSAELVQYALKSGLVGM